MRRAPGSGSVDRLPSGRWRARVRLDTGAQVSLGVSDTEAEARALLAAGVRQLAARHAAPTGPLTLRAWGKTWLAAREGDGIRGIVQERSVWTRHVLAHPIADLPLREITRRQVLAWMEAVRATRLPGSERERAFRLVVQLLDQAVDDMVHDRGIGDG